MKLESFAFPSALILCIFFFGFSFEAKSQSWASRALNQMFNDTLNPEKPKAIVYPTVAFSPETSWEIGVASVLVYYAKQDTTNRLSEISGFTFFTLEEQYGAHFEHAFYTDKNKWYALGNLKTQSYPLLYYGIGPEISGEPLAIAYANFTLIRERLLRKIKGPLYIGFEVDYERLSQVDMEWLDPEVVRAPVNGQDGYSNLGLGFGLVYDSRHNVLNVREGFLSEIGYLMYRNEWGSTNNLNTLFLDNRIHIKTRKNQVLGAQLLGQFSEGDVPFNQLSMIGGEFMMRGYYLGKYRDKNMLSFQMEYRWLPFPFSKRLGGALFAGLGSVSPTLDFNKKLWTTGMGLRALIFPKRDIYTRIDVGLNPEGYGIYFFIGEAF